MHAIALVGAALAATFLLGCQSPSPTAASSQRPAASRLTPATNPTAKPVQILVKFKAGMRAADVQAFRAEFGTRNVGEIKGLGILVEEVVTRKPVQEILDEMNANPLVEYAELNGEVGIR
jgi:hypothetical protein